MSSLQLKTRECGYTDAGRQICEQFTVMIDDTKMQDELLAKLSDTSTADDALKITHKIEAKRQQKSAIQQEQKEFNAVQRGQGGNRGDRGQGRGRGRGQNGSRYRSQSNDGCRYCGKCHPPKQCPAWGKECRKCGKKNHFENKCRSDRSQSRDTNKKQSRGKSQCPPKSKNRNWRFHEAERNEDFDDWYGAAVAGCESRRDQFEHDSVHIVQNVDNVDSEQFQLKSIDPIVPSSNTKCFYFDIDDVKYSNVCRNDFAPPGVRQRLMVNLNIASKTKHQRVRTKIDSGLDGNLLTLSVYISLFPGATCRSLLQSVDPNVSLYAYNGTEIQQLGRCKLKSLI